MSHDPFQPEDPRRDAPGHSQGAARAPGARPVDTAEPVDTGEQDSSLVEQEARARFARVFAQHDRWLYAYLVSLLGSPADAEEVFQEVCVVLWRGYEAFDPETSFVKWASVVAHNQVKRFRRSQSRRAHPLSDEVVDLLAIEAVEHADLMESRRAALDGCLQKLSPTDRRLVEVCYGDARVTFRQVAAEIGRPANTVYKAINRIRRALHACIDRTLAAERLT